VIFWISFYYDWLSVSHPIIVRWGFVRVVSIGISGLDLLMLPDGVVVARRRAIWLSRKQGIRRSRGTLESITIHTCYHYAAQSQSDISIMQMTNARVALLKTKCVADK
jgi:hypothetical protein